MSTEVFKFRMAGGLVYTGENIGETGDTIFVKDDRVGTVELSKSHIVAIEKIVNKSFKRTDSDG